MAAASFVTLFFWVAVLAFGCLVIGGIADWFQQRDEREKERRVAEMIARREQVQRSRAGDHEGTPYIREATGTKGVRRVNGDLYYSAAWLDEERS